MLRLDKYLADMGIGTRQEVKKYIRQGRVSVDGDVVKKPEYKVDEKVMEVTFDNESVGYCRYEYYMLNKPAGVISASRDPNAETVVDLIDNRRRKDLFPVGRLDKDTEGLLLITNDGELSHDLLSPKSHVDKSYYAKIRGIVTEEDREKFAKGIDIGTTEKPEQTMPAELVIVNTDKLFDISEIRITIREGKYHQIKRMFQAVGKEVIYLKRERMGSLVLDENLALSEYRELTEEEVEALRLCRKQSC